MKTGDQSIRSLRERYIGRRVWGLLEGITEEDSLLVLASPVSELHCWCSRPRGGTVEGVFSTTTGEEGDLVDLDSTCAITMTVTLDARHIECTSH